MAETAPTRFGRYEIVEQLAVGGMAQLFRARVVGAHGFEKQVVIKKILPHLAQDATFRDMFIDEAKIVVRLSHPKIVQVLELGVEGDALFIAMELVDGLDVLALLRGVIKKKRALPVEIAAFIAHEVLDALDFAHSATDEAGRPLGVVHRDISPGNILVSRRGHVKLTDFGIARAADRHQKTETGTLKGKFSYMSPEQILGHELDHRSDLFSVGTVLAEMLMGRHLFAAPNELDVLLMVRDVRLDRLEKYGAQIPDDLSEILGRALTRKPDDRFQSAADFRDALADWMFARGQRVGARQLADFLDSLDDRAVVNADAHAVSTLSGPATRQQQLDAEEAARVGRALFSRGETSDPGLHIPDAIPELVADAASDGIIIDEAPVEEAVPDKVAELSTLSPVQLLFDMAVGQRSGRLVAEQGNVLKEAYFEAGHPVFVRSNVMAERLGQFLVRNNVISSDELSRALGVLPHFGGRLGDTLVGLGLMKPMQAVRYLGQQVRDKVVDLCTWERGTIRWYEGARNPWPAVALHLDTYEIIGRGVNQIAGDHLEAWGFGAASQTVGPGLPVVDPGVFRLGGRLGYVFNMIDGRRTVGELAQHFRAGDQRQEFLRMLYLLVNTRAARLS